MVSHGADTWYAHSVITLGEAVHLAEQDHVAIPRVQDNFLGLKTGGLSAKRASILQAISSAAESLLH